MSDTVTLTIAATVEVHIPGVGRHRHRFEAGEHPLDHEDPAVAAATAELVRVLERHAQVVPDNVADVKEWVGDDPARAAVALDVERARTGGPRSTLEPWLAGLAEPDDDAGDDTGAADQES